MISIVQKRVIVNMLKVGSKRRRTTAEVKDSRRESDKMEMDLQMKLAEMKAFEWQLKLKQNDLNNGKEAMSIVNGLIKAGSLKQETDGSWTVMNPPEAPQSDMQQ